MNATNALLFAAFGFLMEIAPRAFPSLFPSCGSYQYSCRALWLFVMGATQITIGVGFLALNNVGPFALRAIARTRAQIGGQLALPEPRGVTIR
ncbi:MAG TPA: hypothetical protein VFE25_15530 [Opitutaceae bacterium]|jgi:hypothetical protein|nr:hypothetical protein [Opitutaceae bacterium]